MLGWFFSKEVRIVMTSLIGSFAFIRGISCFFPGSYPSEMEIQRELASGYLTWDSFPKTFYVYLGCFVLLVILSVIFQKKQNKEEDNDK